MEILIREKTVFIVTGADGKEYACETKQQAAECVTEMLGEPVVEKKRMGRPPKDRSVAAEQERQTGRLGLRQSPSKS